MSEKLLYRKLAVGGDGVVLGRRGARTPSTGRLENPDLHVFEFGDKFRDGVAERDLAFLDHHHHGRADHGLGHGGHAEEGVALHGSFGFEVHDASRVDPGDLTLARDERDGARDFAGIDVALNHLVDALQTVRGEADVFRLRRTRQRSRREDESYTGQSRDGEEGVKVGAWRLLWRLALGKYIPV